MKRVYWRPRAVSRTALLLIAAASLAGLLLVEFRPHPVQQPYYTEKLDASALAERCMLEIRKRRMELLPPINRETDPNESGLIGEAMTAATSYTGVLAAKQISVNPNFAAVVVDMLKRAGVKKGDAVAIGYSGSFPALNICVMAAVQTLELEPIGIASASASQWGANRPDLLWVDMELALLEAGLVNFRSVAASLGGVEDRGVGMAEETRRTLLAGTKRVGLPEIESESFTESINKRMSLYHDIARERGARIRAYINVGGGATSVGKTLGKKAMHSGLNLELPPAARNIDSVMTRFLNEKVPVIHLVRVADIAARYGLPTEPGFDPQVGQGAVFNRMEYNRWYAALVLLAILVSLYVFIRSDWGFRVFQTAPRPNEIGHPEPMV
jgi:poly-gamma-glutamate system protein